MPGVPINDGNEVRAPRYLDLRQGKLVDGKSAPFDSAEEGLAATVDSRKADGFPFYVRNGEIIETWRFKDNGSDPWTAVKDESGGDGTPYSLPIASDEILGGIKVGANLSINEEGILSANSGGNYNIDGGTSISVYLPSQKIDGGSALI